jgi:tetratricopeptide (TPR) repeat protein
MRPRIQPERCKNELKRRGFLSLSIALLFAAPAARADEQRVANSYPSPPASLSSDPLVREGLAAEARFDSKTALDLFLRAEAANPDNAFLLQKISRQYSDLTVETSDVAEKKRLCIESLAYGKRAAELQPDNAVNVLSLAICYGKLGLYSDIRTRIEYSRLVRQYAERALALNPDYDYAHHVLGRWHYEVASLGAGTRFFVKLIYGGLPPASTAEAVRHLERAVELSPARPSHRVELGFALLADGQREAARETFEQALTLPIQEKYDEESRGRAREALVGLK